MASTLEFRFQARDRLGPVRCDPAPDATTGGFVALLSFVVGVLARAIVVPSTARRTLVIGVVGALVLVALAVFRGATEQQALGGTAAGRVLGGDGGHDRHARVAHDLRASQGGSASEGARSIHARIEDWPGWDGRCLAGEPLVAQAPDRGEALTAEPHGRGRDPPLRTRGSAHGSTDSPEHGRHLRLRAHA